MYMSLGDTQELLREGSTGEQVRALQQRLNEKGFTTGGIDGIFGPQTAAAVKKFQGNMGLTIDGVVGPQTWAALQTLGPATVPAPPVPLPAMVAPVVPPPTTGAAPRRIAPATLALLGIASIVLFSGARKR